ncbi:MAG: hypothetical protein KDK55_03185 [Chlamydiia bacterium]|nr:hypothetical protein [Chlamydiia bacterium]
MGTRLINVKTGDILVEFVGEKTFFYNKFLENEMRDLGIVIPHGMRGLYEGNDKIRLKDSLFQQAFREIYYLTSMNPDLFIWKEE